MGYELHITKREHWADTEAPGISFDEWLTYVNRDKELKLGEEQNDQGFCEWNAHPTEKVPNSKPWFSYYNGNIDTKNPDAHTIRKMMEIASVFEAKVQGDDGEIYSEEYLTELENLETRKSLTKQQNSKPWWKFW